MQSDFEALYEQIIWHHLPMDNGVALSGKIARLAEAITTITLPTLCTMAAIIGVNHPNN